MTFDRLRYGQICVPVAVAILEECCMAFANMQTLFLSGERIVAHGPLVFYFLPDMAVEPRRLLKHLITEEKVKQVSYVH